MTDGDLGTEWRSRNRESIDILLFAVGVSIGLSVFFCFFFWGGRGGVGLVERFRVYIGFSAVYLGLAFI